ncbi:MAG: low molecular weight phosphotyrosine protein phosphatase [bacterium]|nr:phosphotyrosine protein phosphatase [Deltaproteobacteria bacterium]MCP4908674.1 low molecular weight phosphotyrosine protein phosphatase [bacterium]
MAQKTVRVCFVCLGNICRSPTAEGVMRRLVEDQGLSERFEIDSAGTAAHHAGERADPRARQAAQRRGIALDSRARPFAVEDFFTQHYVLAMDRENLENLEALAKGADFRGRLSLFRDFDPEAKAESEVPDPYYGGDAGFEEVLDLCEAACRGLIEQIRRDGMLE